MADIALPPSASAERTQVLTKQVEAIARTIPKIENILVISGRGMISGTGSNYGMVVMRLKNWAERGGEGQDVQSVIGKPFAKTGGIRDAKIIFFAPPTISGFGTSGGFSFESLLQAELGGANDQLQCLQAVVNLYRSLGGGWR